MSLAVAINQSSSEGLGAESKITYVKKLCSRRQPKEMISETNVCTRQSLELESWRRANMRKRDDIRVGQTNKSSVKKEGIGNQILRNSSAEITCRVDTFSINLIRETRSLRYKMYGLRTISGLHLHGDMEHYCPEKSVNDLKEWRQQTGRHNGLQRPIDNRRSLSQNNHVIFSRVFEWNTRNRRREETQVTRKERSRKRSEKTRAGRLRKRRGESQSFYPCCCPRVKNADEKQRLADWKRQAVSGFKTGIPYRL
ncbi:hypothetical protein TNCV_3728281 [Trichonephila clavipes]|nr:hypothetical protein TNCV_3728281 [Trichonephila clavipes]